MIEELEKQLNYTFKNRDILQNALIHKSYNEGLRNDLPDNEKLEFLGDSVINLVITQHLFKTYKNWSEGELSKLKSHLVSSNSLSAVAGSISLSDFLLLGKGEEKNNGRANKKISASLFEAVIGAVYIDSNFKVTAAVVISFFKEILERFSEKEIKINDYKSELQEIIQGKENVLPIYKIVDESGKPPHVVFTAAVYLGSKEVGRGKGRNKRQAEQDAAADALKKLNSLDNYEELSEIFFFKK
ncbi:MAG: ribonuclease III [Candidatus Aminicenantes bacterium]|nr:ribonuclease III [Candidatus Aminicenantes bacterium]